MSEELKPALTGLFCDNPETPEGKYLVTRRDGTDVEWPSFILGARDPIAEVALRKGYAAEVKRLLEEEPEVAKQLCLSWAFYEGVLRRADFFAEIRAKAGTGDPGAGKHRKDDPETVARMRKCMGS